MRSGLEIAEQVGGVGGVEEDRSGPYERFHKTASGGQARQEPIQQTVLAARPFQKGPRQGHTSLIRISFQRKATKDRHIRAGTSASLSPLPQERGEVSIVGPPIRHGRTGADATALLRMPRPCQTWGPHESPCSRPHSERAPSPQARRLWTYPRSHPAFSKARDGKHRKKYCLWGVHASPAIKGPAGNPGGESACLRPHSGYTL